MKKEYYDLINEFILNMRMNALDEYDKWSPSHNCIWRELGPSDGKLKRRDCIFAIESKFRDRLLCKVFVGELFVHEFILLPGAVQWIFNGCPIFTPALAYHDVHIELYDIFTNEKKNEFCNIYYMHFFNHEIRRAMLQHGYSCDISDKSYFIALYGLGGIFDRVKKYKSEHHFNRLKPLDLDARRKNVDFINKIKQELIEKAYHPSRYYNWCLDEDAKRRT
jgi:hypothetical protein